MVVNRFVLLLAQEVRLGEQEDWNRRKREEEEEVLHLRLAGVHWLVDDSRLQGDVDEGGDEVGRLASVSRSTVSQRALVSSCFTSVARSSIGETGSVTASVAVAPIAVVVGAAPCGAGRVDAGGGEHTGVPVDGPLHEDQDDHVDEEGCGEDGHGDELEHQVKLLSKVEGVESLQARSQEHLDDTEDDRELHLEGVEEEELVLGDVPHRIQTEWVDGFRTSVLCGGFGDVILLDGALVLSVECPAGAEQVEAKREAVVVDHTSVDGEEAHHDDHVATGMQSFKHLAELGVVVRLFVVEEVASAQEEEGSVTDITVHDSEKERESGGGEKGWVGLPITWDTVGVHELLVSVRELVGHVVGWWRWPRLRDVVHKTWHGHVHVGVGSLDGVLDLVEVLGDDPSLSAEHSGNVSLELVEGVVDRLLADDDPSPALGVLGKHLAETVSRVLVLQQDGAGIDQLLGVLGEHGLDGRRIVHVGEAVSVGLEGVADLLELGLDAFGLVEDDEHALLNEGSGFRIGDGLLDRGESHVAVSAGGTEDHALEAVLLVCGHDSGDGGEAHVEIWAGSQPFRLEEVGGVVRAAVSRGELGNSKARGVGHEEATGLLEHLLELHLLVVLAGQLLAVRVELAELGLVAVQLVLEALQQLSAGRRLCIGGSADDRWGFQEGVDGSCGLDIELELVDLSGEEAQLALELVATLDVRHVPALERGQIRVEISELEHTALSEVRQAVMRGILVHDDGDVLHRLGTEPFRHVGNRLLLLTQRRNKRQLDSMGLLLLVGCLFVS
mmetsp:Transcript_25713/g.71848  ORF Transcript_25713/g.71848 Transcript_25713/m.71848 type:complete len:783 (-) Transcript_25713:14-2362(-)